MAKKSKKERKEKKQLQMKERAAKREKQREASKPKVKKEAEPEPLPRQPKPLKLTGKQIQATVLKRKRQAEARPKPVKRSEEPLNISLKQLKKGIQGRKKQMQDSDRKAPATTPEAPGYKPTPEKQNLIDKAAEERIPLLPGDMVKIPSDSIMEDTNFFSDAVIRGFENIIKQFPKNAEPVLQEWLDEMIARNGKDDVATMLQEGAEDGHVVNREIAYDSEKLATYMADMMDYLPEMTDWAKAEVLESFETWDFFA